MFRDSSVPVLTSTLLPKFSSALLPSPPSQLGVQGLTLLCSLWCPQLLAHLFPHCQGNTALENMTLPFLHDKSYWKIPWMGKFSLFQLISLPTS